jgi:hypothetical protein
MDAPDSRLLVLVLDLRVDALGIGAGHWLVTRCTLRRFVQSAAVGRIPLTSSRCVAFVAVDVFMDRALERLGLDLTLDDRSGCEGRLLTQRRARCGSRVAAGGECHDRHQHRQEGAEAVSIR